MFQPWPTSILSIDKVQASDPVVFAEAGDPAVWFCIALLLFAVMRFTRIATAIAGSCAMFGGEVRMNETLQSHFTCNSMAITYLLCIPFYAVFFTLSGISIHGFWLVLAIMAGYFILRYLVMAGIRVINKADDTMDVIGKLGFAAFIIIGVFLFAILLAKRLFPVISDDVCGTATLVVTVTVMSIYLLRERKIFLGSRFSHFFWFLYLCAFEILPICVVAKALVS